MAFLVPGCVRCRIQCVDSGRTMRARRCWGLGRMHQLGNWLPRVVWVRALRSFSPQFSYLMFFPTCMYKAGGIAGFIGNPGGPPCPPFEVVLLIKILELQRS